MDNIKLKQLANKVIKNLYKIYTPKCALNYKKSFELVVAVILSAQCTDKRVNIVTEKLFKKYKTIKSFAKADIKEFEQDIKSTGFYKNKAKSIINCANRILENYNSKIPDNMNDLLTLPGVGRKTANVILSEIYKKAEGIVVDTHVKRLSKRIGLTKETNPEKIEQELIKIIPKKYWIDYSHLLILHGRNRCKARKPDCINCEINKICKKQIL